MNDSQSNRNLLVAVGLAFLIMFGFDHFFGSSKNQHVEAQVVTEEVFDEEDAKSSNSEPSVLTIQEALESKDRVSFGNNKLTGSINLSGGALDYISLNNFNQTTDKNSGHVELMQPKGTESQYYFTANYKLSGVDIDENAKWEQSGNSALNSATIKLRMDKGIIIERTFTVDDNYLIQVKDVIINTSDEDAKVSGGAVLVRSNPTVHNYAVVHEGVVYQNDGKVKELKYGDLSDGVKLTNSQWAGFTDIYWFVSLINASSKPVLVRGSNIDESTHKLSMMNKAKIIQANSEIEMNYTLFAGPKDLEILKIYKDSLNLDKFERCIDFGWFEIITKPLLMLLDFLHRFISNMGIVILLLTVLFKFITHPLTKKSYTSAAKMKAIQPKVAMLQKTYAHDKLRMNQEMMALYKKEQISPMSGCLPMLLQAPIFFCLYKVFFISIEMRHAPLFGWVKDLSAPDNLYLFNLFGAIDWTPPSFLQIGVWPIIMGLMMFLQQRLTSRGKDTAKTPEAKMQENMMLIMPVMFTFICSSFPVGVVVYWTISNAIGIVQQQLANKAATQNKKR